MAEQPKEPMVKNGVQLQLDSPLVELGGEPILSEPGKNFTLRDYLKAAINRNKSETDLIGLFGLGVEIARHQGSAFDVTAANLEMLQRIVEKDRIRLKNGEEEPASPIIRGQVLRMLR